MTAVPYKRLNQPVTRDRTAPENAALPVPRNSSAIGKPYLYAHFPESWFYEPSENEDGERYGWLPRPSKQRAVPAANGVRDPGWGNDTSPEDLSALYRGIQKKGGLILQPTDPRLGPYMSYDRFYPVENGKRWYIEIGQEATILPGGRVRWNDDEHHAEMLKFYAFLRETTLVHPLAYETYLGIMDVERQLLDRWVMKAASTPSLGFKVDEIRARIEAMEEDYERYAERFDGAGTKPAAQSGTAVAPKIEKKGATK